MSDMFLEDGVNDRQWVCLQCGRRLDVAAATGDAHGLSFALWL